MKHIITVHRPQLSDDERKKRMDELKRCMVSFWRAKEAREGEKR